jgi:exopolysaccharide production protein ExoZ
LIAAAIFLTGVFGFVVVATFDILPSVQGLSYGLPSLLVVAGAVLYERAAPVPRLNIAKLIGDSSYSLYLTHGAVLSGLAQLWRHLAPATMPDIVNMVGFAVVGLAAAGIVGVFTYEAVEQPLLRGISRERPKKSRDGDFNLDVSRVVGESHAKQPQDFDAVKPSQF